MKLKDVLERLKKTIDLSKTLTEEQFDYRDFVSKFDDKLNCGTVCCIAGHYPNWGIEGFEYFDESAVFENSYTIYDAYIKLINYHGLNGNLIDVLFFGDDFYDTFTDELVSHDSLSQYKLHEVIERFETVYKLLENKTISPNWNPYELS